MSTNYNLVIDGDNLSSEDRGRLFEEYETTLNHTIVVDSFGYHHSDMTFTVKKAEGYGSGDVYKRLLSVAIRYAAQGLNTQISLDDDYAGDITRPLNLLKIGQFQVIESEENGTLQSIFYGYITSVEETAVVVGNPSPHEHRNSVMVWYALIDAAHAALGNSLRFASVAVEPYQPIYGVVKVTLNHKGSEPTVLFVSCGLWRFVLKNVAEVL